MEKKAIRVLVTDDSLLFRETLSKILNQDENIDVVGTSPDALDARTKIIALRPDVLVIDVEMPKVSGIEFIKELLPRYKIPVVVISSIGENAFEALANGAVDFVQKPEIKTPQDLLTFSKEMIEKIKIAKDAKIQTIQQFEGGKANFKKVKSEKIIALGASTGGTDALQVVIENLPKTTPPILIVQHMPAVFTNMYAQRLDRCSKMEVREAKNNDRVYSGLVLVAPGEHHMTLEEDRNGYYVKVEKGEKVSGHCPSVDVLFNSVARVAKENAIAAILTGMGADGAKGILEMRKAGAFTIGQDKESCVVYGMPYVAYNIGGVQKQAPLSEISQIIYSNL